MCFCGGPIMTVLRLSQKGGTMMAPGFGDFQTGSLVNRRGRVSIPLLAPVKRARDENSLFARGSGLAKARQRPFRGFLQNAHNRGGDVYHFYLVSNFLPTCSSRPSGTRFPGKGSFRRSLSLVPGGSTKFAGLFWRVSHPPCCSRQSAGRIVSGNVTLRPNSFSVALIASSVVPGKTVGIRY